MSLPLKTYNHRSVSFYDRAIVGVYGLYPVLSFTRRADETRPSLRRAFIDATDVLKSDTARKHSHASRSGPWYGISDNRGPITMRRYCTSGFNIGWHQLIIVFLPGIPADQQLAPSSSLPRLSVDRQTYENCETRATNTKRDDRWGGINKNFRARALKPKSFFEEYIVDVSSYPM